MERGEVHFFYVEIPDQGAVFDLEFRALNLQGLTGVELQDGSEIPCELAVVAIGVQPNSGLAARAGLEIGALGGIAVDRAREA